ncbi:MAG: hemerythrin domain-containing protein [Paludibacterium sp.]|uniref:hemerythrin domain-containing protein n=1 Tax=Paludibacterium sp. TaxID=1917523 RepID=UPI0025CE6EA7|nr:hemerythrin domain-containing protein [Paludibacterium sp.]MBV8049383.1 hemerythrin domain-containing protein [Paludibacterium sp.]MBV8647397.1 hemerythrin domain-containing protein [Paludibacterium sp.]
MKRSTILIPLSREHHSALVLAKRIQAHLDDTAVLEELMRQIPHRHAPGLRAHFDEEERLLPPSLQAKAPLPLRRFFDEHARLRHLLAQIEGGDLRAMQEFATLLAAHVRFEERELFSCFEQLNA